MDKYEWTIVMNSGKEYCIYHKSSTLEGLLDELLPKISSEIRINILELVQPINNLNAIAINGAYISSVLCNGTFSY